MENAPADPNKARAEAVADAKRLMRLARTGALATLEGEDGRPLTTLVGVASDFDGAPLFLMSTLSRHTRNLAHDPRASLLLTGARDRGDPLNHPRVTLGGRSSPIRRGTPSHGICSVIGRRRSTRGSLTSACSGLRSRACISMAALAAPPRSRPPTSLLRAAGEAALTEAEERLIAEVNALGAAVLARLAGHKASPRGLKPGGWRAIGLDGEGLDLAVGGRVARVQFRVPADDPATWRARLEELLAA